MRWKIAEWCASEGRGSGQGKHIGPLQFDRCYTTVTDYTAGEEVAVELSEVDGIPVVKSVFPLAARQPKDSDDADFREVNTLRCWDFELRGLEDGKLTVHAVRDLWSYR